MLIYLIYNTSVHKYLFWFLFISPPSSLSFNIFVFPSHPLSFFFSLYLHPPFIKYILALPLTTKFNNNTNSKYNRSFISVIAHRHALFMFSDISFLTFFFLPIAAYIHKVSLINFVHRGITSKNKNTGITTRQIVLFFIYTDR